MNDRPAYQTGNPMTREEKVLRYLMTYGRMDTSQEHWLHINNSWRYAIDNRGNVYKFTSSAVVSHQTITRVHRRMAALVRIAML